MIIIGHRLIPFKPLFRVESIKDIEKTPPNSTVVFNQSSSVFFELTEFCKKNKISFANIVVSEREALISSANGASYLIVPDQKCSQEIQGIADHYLFSAKVLLRINNEDDMKTVAKLGIDGVIFPDGEVNV